MQEGQQPVQPEANWSYTNNDAPAGVNSPDAPHVSVIKEVTWTASEYVAHQKTSGWYVLLGLGAVAASLLIFLLTRDKITSGMIIVVGLMFGIFAAKQPRVLNYSVDHSGVKIGDKFYGYHEFKSFSILDEGPISSILLVPMKRFMPGLSMYYPPEQEDSILNVLANYLPHEERQPDPLDRLMRKVRF